MTFKELSIGQRFRLVSFPNSEWIKVDPVRFPAGHVQYNAQSDDHRTNNIGHSAKVFVPPYADATQPHGDTTGAKRQAIRYAQYKARCLSAGWDSIAQMETAIITGQVEPPPKPQGDMQT